MHLSSATSMLISLSIGWFDFASFAFSQCSQAKFFAFAELQNVFFCFCKNRQKLSAFAKTTGKNFLLLRLLGNTGLVLDFLDNFGGDDIDLHVGHLAARRPDHVRNAIDKILLETFRLESSV